MVNLLGDSKALKPAQRLIFYEGVELKHIQVLEYSTKG